VCKPQQPPLGVKGETGRSADNGGKKGGPIAFIGGGGDGDSWRVKRTDEGAGGIRGAQSNGGSKKNINNSGGKALFRKKLGKKCFGGGNRKQRKTFPRRMIQNHNNKRKGPQSSI